MVGDSTIAPRSRRVGPSALLETARWHLLKSGPLVGGPDWLECLFLAGAAGVVFTAWLALTLGELGAFSLPILLALELGSFGLLVWRSRRDLALHAAALRRPRLPDLLFLVLLISVSPYYLRPFEFILGGLDPGVYVNAGAQMARTGSVAVYDGDLASLPESLRQALFSDTRLAMFYIEDAPAGMVSSHGFHLYPALLAVGHSLGGVKAELMVTPVLALMGLAALYLLARRLFGSPVALLAVLLQAIGVGQAWFGRYPSPEIMVQFLLFTGLLFLAVAFDTRARRYGLWAGLCLAAVHLTKIEFVSLPLVLAAFLSYEYLSRRFGPHYRWLVGGYAVLTGQAIVHAYLFARSYTTLHIGVGIDLLKEISPALVFVGLLAVACLFFAVARSRRRGPLFSGTIPWQHVRLTLALGSCLLAAFAYYVRPIGSVPTVPLESLSLKALSDMVNSQSFVHLGWYVTPLGLLVGVLGFACFASAAASRRNAVLVALFLVEAVWNLYAVKATPYHFWLARRWMPLVIPGFALFGSFLLVWLGARLRWRWPGVLVPGGLAAVMLVSSLGADLMLIRHTEYQGALAQLGALSDQFPDDSVLLFDDGDAGLRLSVPLQYLWGKSSFVLWNGSPARADLGEAVRYWEQRGRPVYWLRWAEMTRSDEPIPAGVRLIHVGARVIDLPEVAVSRDSRPSTIGRFLVTLSIDRVVAD